MEVSIATRVAVGGGIAASSCVVAGTEGEDEDDGVEGEGAEMAIAVEMCWAITQPTIFSRANEDGEGRRNR